MLNVTNPEDRECLRLGREMLRLMREVYSTPQSDVAYCRRRFTMRQGGAVNVFVVRGDDLADAIDKAVEARYAVTTVTPKSEVH